MKLLSKGPFAAIFWGGLLAGIFDLTQAFIGFSLMGSTPFRILQAVAGGIFGRHSRAMGWTSAAVGLFCHFTVAFGAATVYYIASRKLRVLVERPVLAHVPDPCASRRLQVPQARVGRRAKRLPASRFGFDLWDLCHGDVELPDCAGRQGAHSRVVLASSGRDPRIHPAEIG